MILIVRCSKIDCMVHRVSPGNMLEEENKKKTREDKVIGCFLTLCCIACLSRSDIRPKFRFKKEGNMEKFPMSAASMSP